MFRLRPQFQVTRPLYWDDQSLNLISTYLTNKAFSSLSIDVFELFDIFSNSLSLSSQVQTWLLWMSITPPVQSSKSNATFLSPRSPSILSDEQSPKIPNYIHKEADASLFNTKPMHVEIFHLGRVLTLRTSWKRVKLKINPIIKILKT